MDRSLRTSIGVVSVYLSELSISYIVLSQAQESVLRTVIGRACLYFCAIDFVVSTQMTNLNLTISSLDAARTGSSFSSTINTLSSLASFDSRFIVDLWMFENYLETPVSLRIN
jgi:hypothetical protein